MIPQPNTKLACGRDTRLRETLLLPFASVEPLHRGIESHGVARGFTPEESPQRVALFRYGAEPLPRPTGVLARDHPDVTGEGLAVAEAGRIPEEALRRSCRDRADAWMRHQQDRGGSFSHDVADVAVEPFHLVLQRVVQLEQGRSPRGGVRQQWHRRDRLTAVTIPQGMAPANPVRERDRLKRVLHARPHANPLVSMQQ